MMVKLRLTKNSRGYYVLRHNIWDKQKKMPRPVDVVYIGNCRDSQKIEEKAMLKFPHLSLEERNKLREDVQKLPPPPLSEAKIRKLELELNRTRRNVTLFMHTVKGERSNENPTEMKRLYKRMRRDNKDTTTKSTLVTTEEIKTNRAELSLEKQQNRRTQRQEEFLEKVRKNQEGKHFQLFVEKILPLMANVVPEEEADRILKAEMAAFITKTKRIKYLFI